MLRPLIHSIKLSLLAGKRRPRKPIQLVYHNLFRFNRNRCVVGCQQFSKAALRSVPVPGIGPVISSAAVAAIGTGDGFSKGRGFVKTPEQETAAQC
jgi:hypothetical protein